jgi:NAD(P) transhydrogenase
LNLQGTVDYFVQNTFNYPTLAEAYKIAGLDAFNRMPIPDEYKVMAPSKAKKPAPKKNAEKTEKAASKAAE